MSKTFENLLSFIIKLDEETHRVRKVCARCTRVCEEHQYITYLNKIYCLKCSTKVKYDR